MLYLMTVLTFLAGILFYLLSPRDDKLHLDTYQAEPMIQEFLAQHQAAKDYLRRWFGADYKQSSTAYYNLDPDFFEHSFYGLHGDVMCEDNVGDPDDIIGKECYISRVICTKNGGVDYENCSAAVPEGVYFVTYGGWAAACERPSWWPSKTKGTRRYERWRRALGNRIHGSLTCGTLFRYPVDAPSADLQDWCLDTGLQSVKDDACVKIVPKGVISQLNATQDCLDDSLLCISNLRQGASVYYPGGLISLWDPLDNRGYHAPIPSGRTRIGTGEVVGALGDVDREWLDVVSGKVAYSGGAGVVFGEFPQHGIEFTQDGTLRFESIKPGPNQNFTISILVRFQGANLMANLFDFASNSGRGFRIYKAPKATGQDKIVLYLQDTAGNYDEVEVPFTKDDTQIYQFSLVREYKHLYLYEGDTRLLDLNLETNEARAAFNNMLGEVMKIKWLDNTAGDILYLFGVRYFDRSLSQTELAKMLHEETHRYPVSKLKNPTIPPSHVMNLHP